jgi:cell division FtsZ-interacting protein ZapD
VQGISTRLSPISSERIGQLAMGAAALIEWMRQRYNYRGGVGNEDCPAAAEA